MNNNALYCKFLFYEDARRFGLVDGLEKKIRVSPVTDLINFINLELNEFGTKVQNIKKKRIHIILNFSAMRYYAAPRIQ